MGFAANVQSGRQTDIRMPSPEARKPVSTVAPINESRTAHKSDFTGSAKATGEFDMEPRFAELETHLKYIRRDMDEVRGDVKAIKHRLAYSAGATAVVLGVLGWVANSRFDQLVSLIGH
jgi:Flp pilus assembly protein TadB